MGHGLAWKHDCEYSRILQSISPTFVFPYIPSAIYLHLSFTNIFLQTPYWQKWV